MKKHILIVDDEPHMTRVLKMQLERVGYTVTTCPNGREALASIHLAPPDVMVTDIQMPVMTGQELCQAIHAEMPDRSFPIFVMTSMTDREHREWTAEIPRLQLLEKPLSMRILMQKFDQVFGAAD